MRSLDILAIQILIFGMQPTDNSFLWLRSTSRFDLPQGASIGQQNRRTCIRGIRRVGIGNNQVARDPQFTELFLPGPSPPIGMFQIEVDENGQLQASRDVGASTWL